jgi:hypothetical protein
LKNAEAAGAKIYLMYKNAGDCVQSTKKKLRKSALRSSGQQFFDAIETREINEQLLFVHFKSDS